KVYGSHPPSTAIRPSWSWFNPFAVHDINTFAQGIVLMLFIYWGWDSAVSVNEETKDRDKTPGRAAIISTLLLLAIYAVVSVAAQAFAGVGTHGIGLANSDNSGDVLSVLGGSIFGNSGFGTVMVKLLLLMVLSSAAASTQTTILPTARTTLSMAAFKAIPTTFAKIHPRFFTPTSSTIWMGLISAIIYVPMNFYFGGGLIGDAVTAIGVMIAFYYGFTGLACVWYYRKELGKSASDFLMKGLIPFLGGAMLWTFMGYTIYEDWAPDSGNVAWKMHFPPHWDIGFPFILGVGTFLIGVVLMLICAVKYRPFFTGMTLNRDTPIFLAEDAPITAATFVLPDSPASELLVAPDQDSAARGRSAPNE
ncbi:hypothetical protein, partial [Jatrophihabitans sp.]|uniref:APC family permease n=1 Tax=Jatrophihabitans sp. TaxID=1932789 RepID=UPI0030C745B2|nr:Amino acid/polyamine/organocation transporter superfamily [Jatrophihabitans sp.]